MSQGLPRELLKWLQGLDLSYSIKNVRRDFSNGFLIAEIFSRYYVSDIQMGGYDNGFSLQRKLDNWDQLNKFFVKRGIQIDKALIHDVVHCKSQQGPVELVSAVYTALTGRELKKRPEDPSEGAADPAFMRNTNASLLHQQTRESELKTSLVDRDQQKAVHSEVIEAHEADLRADRAADPGRYATMSGYGGSITASQKLLRGPPKPIAQAMETAAVRFQEVKVKPVDQNIAQLRASREASSLAQLSGAGGSGVGGAGPPLPSVVGVLTDALLGEAELVQALGGGAHLGADPDAFRSFLKRLGDVPADAAARLFVSLCADGETLAKSAVGSPKQAWLLFHLLTTALSAAPPPVFDAVAALLAQVGAHAVAADAVAAESLMRDFGLPPLLVLCKAMPTRLRPLLALVYAFAPDTTAAHIGVIKGLQEALDEPQARTRPEPPAPPLPRPSTPTPTTLSPRSPHVPRQAFVQMLTVLVTLEATFDDDLLDLYLYYAVIGLGMSSSRLRAAATSMLPTLAAHNPPTILRLLPRLSALAADGWWEVQAQTARVCVSLLAQPAALDAAAAAELTRLLCGALASRNPSVAAVALSEAAPLLASSPDLLEPSLRALLLLPPPQRAALLLPSADAPALPLTSASYALAPLPASWPALAVARDSSPV